MVYVKEVNTPLQKLEENFAEESFAKTYGTVTGARADREKNWPIADLSVTSHDGE